MDIVDSQIHLFMDMDEAQALAAMDALGIRAALIDEVWQMTGGGDDTLHPSVRLPEGISRTLAPGAMMASMRHPDRFAWLLRIHPDDPDLDNEISRVRLAPQGRAVRLEVNAPREAKLAAEGGRMNYFKALEKQGVPLFLMTPGHSRAYEQHIRACPDLPITIDHCGFPQQVAEFDDVLALAAYPNVHLKWCHAPTVFRSQRFPFPEVTAHLARAIDAFGADRIMWASDYSAVPFASETLKRNDPYCWGEALFAVRTDASLSEGDKQWILGATARRFLDWPVG